MAFYLAKKKCLQPQAPTVWNVEVDPQYVCHLNGDTTAWQPNNRLHAGPSKPQPLPMWQPIMPEGETLNPHLMYRHQKIPRKLTYDNRTFEDHLRQGSDPLYNTQVPIPEHGYEQDVINELYPDRKPRFTARSSTSTYIYEEYGERDMEAYVNQETSAFERMRISGTDTPNTGRLNPAQECETNSTTVRVITLTDQSVTLSNPNLNNTAEQRKTSKCKSKPANVETSSISKKRFSSTSLLPTYQPQVEFPRVDLPQEVAEQPMSTSYWDAFYPNPNPLSWIDEMDQLELNEIPRKVHNGSATVTTNSIYSTPTIRMSESYCNIQPINAPYPVAPQSNAANGSSSTFTLSVDNGVPTVSANGVPISGDNGVPTVSASYMDEYPDTENSSHTDSINTWYSDEIPTINSPNVTEFPSDTQQWMIKTVPNNEPPGGLLACQVSPEGTIRITLRNKATLELTIDGGARLCCANTRCVIAANATGTAIGLLHPIGRIMQEGEDVGVITHVPRNNKKYASFIRKGVTFTSDRSSLTYLLDEGGLRTMRRRVCSNMFRDYTGAILRDESRTGPRHISDAVETLRYGTTYTEVCGNETWLVGNVIVTQSLHGHIRVEKNDKGYELSTSPTSGYVFINGRRIHATADLHGKPHLYALRDNYRVYYECEIDCFITRDGNVTAAMDRDGNVTRKKSSKTRRGGRKRRGRCRCTECGRWQW